MEAQTRPRRLTRVLVASGLAVGLVAGTGGIAVGEIQKVKAVDGNKFKPKHKYINKGDKVRWKNRDNITHNVKAMGKKWDYFAKLKPGETATRKFGKVGTFKYRCTLHSSVSAGKCNGMCGFIHVA